MKQITSFLETIKLARKQGHRNMTLFPLLAPDGITPHYLVMEQALDALDSVDTSNSDSPPPDMARRFIASARKGKGETPPSTGLGTNIMFVSETVSGAALVEEDRVLHSSAFRKDDKGRL